MGYKKERIKEEETIDIWRIDYEICNKRQQERQNN